MSATKAVVVFVLLAAISGTDSASLALKKKKVIYYPSSNCSSENFLCENKKCIPRKWHCDGENDCGDNSDEVRCGYSYYQCPSYYAFWRCNSAKCIPMLWKCDGVVDCRTGEDEVGCTKIIDSIVGSQNATYRAEHWLHHQRNNSRSPVNQWGTKALRTSVALFFSNSKYFAGNNATGQSIAYEVSQRFLERLIREKMNIDNLSSNDLALYINALTVSCMDARDFNGIDLVTRLKNQVENSRGSISPFALLAVCNAAEELSTQQIAKLYSLSEEYDTSPGKLALALMSLSCVADRDSSRMPLAKLTLLASKLKQTQHEDGSFENVPTTALVLQSLIASGEDGGDAFKKAVKYLVQSQASDGSFGSLLNTYYAMPVLQYRSLLDLDTMHCGFGDKGKEVEDLQVTFKTRQVHVTYSIGVGDQFDVVHTITLRVPVNITFFDVMKTASTVDQKYRFKYVSRNAKPFVYELNGIQDDEEQERYWFLFNGTQNAATPIHSSPADVVILESGSFMMWYRSQPSNSTSPVTTTPKSRNDSSLIF